MDECGRPGPAPRGHSGKFEYPTRDAEPAGGATARQVALHRGVPVPPLPRSRAALRGRADACPDVRRAGHPGARADRRHRAAARHLRAVRRVPRHDRRDLRVQHRRARLPAGGDRRRVPRRRVPQRSRRVGRRSARPREAAPQPPVDRRARRGRARAGRHARRGRALGPARPGRPRELHLRERGVGRGVRAGGVGRSVLGPDRADRVVGHQPRSDRAGDARSDPHRHADPLGRGPAVGRQGAAQHPAHRRRRAEGCAQHRHADHGLDRPGHQAGGDVQPAARHRRRAGAAGPRPAGVGPQLRQQDQLASSSRTGAAPTSGPATSARAATTPSSR